MSSLSDRYMRKVEKSAEQKLQEKMDALSQRTGMSESDMFSFADYDEAEAEKTGYSNYSYWRSTLNMFMKNKVAVVMLVVMLAIIIFAAIQPYLPGQLDPNACNMDPLTFIQDRNVQPNEKYWLGTNVIGQDLWARIWAGTRNSLIIGFSVAAVEAVVGIIVGVMGLILGYSMLVFLGANGLI